MRITPERAAEIKAFTESEYTCISDRVRSYLADLLAERELLLAERKLLMAVVETLPDDVLDDVDDEGWDIPAATHAAVRAYRAASTGEAGQSIVCMDPQHCQRTDHAAGAGGTLVHLPPDGKIVPGLFDHGVPSDATTGEAGQ